MLTAAELKLKLKLGLHYALLDVCVSVAAAMFTTGRQARRWESERASERAWGSVRVYIWVHSPLCLPHPLPAYFSLAPSPPLQQLTARAADVIITHTHTHRVGKAITRPVSQPWLLGEITEPCHRSPALALPACTGTDQDAGSQGCVCNGGRRVLEWNIPS